MRNDVDASEVTPESLMNTFHGPGFSKMIIVTIVVHAVVILGTSVPFLLESVLGDDSSELSKEERIENAVADATSSLQQVADEHGLSLQEVREQISKGATRKVAELKPVPVAEPETEPEKPKSTIEQELEKKAAGPALPDVSTDIEDEEEEDLFK